MQQTVTANVGQTEACGAQFAKQLSEPTVVALCGDLGMGKTAFVRGMASVLSPNAAVSSPTFALVHDYGGDPPLVHFDMYRVSGWDDLETTGYFDYLEAGAILAVEWSENIAAALPPNTVYVTIQRIDDTTRRIWIGDRPI